MDTDEPKLTLRNVLSIVGAVLTAAGGFLTSHSGNGAAWWAGSLCVVIGPVLMSSRAILK